MKTRKYISALIIILTILGVVSQQQTSIANQEIVLQFDNVDIVSNDAQNTIAIIKKQLQVLGVDNIQVFNEQNGTLKITYYSASDVASIKEKLSQNNSLKLDFATPNQNKNSKQFPSDKDHVSYNLDINEIQKTNDADWSLDGYVLEFKTESDRFSNSNTVTFINKQYKDDSDESEKTAYKINRNIAIAINNSSYNIPEVRAGPNLF